MPGTNLREYDYKNDPYVDNSEYQAICIVVWLVCCIAAPKIVIPVSFLFFISFCVYKCYSAKKDKKEWESSISFKSQ